MIAPGRVGLASTPRQTRATTVGGRVVRSRMRARRITVRLGTRRASLASPGFVIIYALCAGWCRLGAVARQVPRATPQGLAVFEEVSRHAFQLPKKQQGDDGSFLTQLNDLITPAWAVQFLVTPTP